MNRQRNDVMCDLCKSHHLTAIVTCETHSLDLCESHMRKHFDREACRLVPVKREPTELETLVEQAGSEQAGSDAELTELVKRVAERLREKDKGAGQEGTGQA